MQIIQVYLEPGEGEKAAQILKDLDIKDFTLLSSGSGDFILIRDPKDKTDKITAKFSETFKFENEGRRGLVISTPDVIFPKISDGENRPVEKSAWALMVEYGEQNSSLNSRYLALFIFSTIVAALGLITDNIAVVVGAMIIAPAFGPIASAAIGIVSGRMDLFRSGIKAEIVGIIVAISISALLGFLLPGIELNDSLRTRMYPTIFDLFIALSAGAAGGYVLVSSKSPSVVGVMVAAALVPVMAAIGIGFIFLNPLLVLGAFLLLIVNVVSISLAMVTVFWIAGPKQEIQVNYQPKKGKSDVEEMVEGMRQSYQNKIRQETIRRTIKYSIVLIFILAVPLMWLTYEDMIARSPEKEIGGVFEGAEYSSLQLGNILIDGTDIHVTLYAFESGAENLLTGLENKIKNRIDPRYDVKFNLVSAKKIS